jgi:protein SCO1/2
MTSGRSAAALLALWAGSAAAQSQAVTAPPPAALQGVEVVEKLGDQVPLDLTFTDSSGQPLALSKILAGDKPVVMSLVYYNCPMLCGLVLTGMTRSMRESGLTLGKDFRALTVSFDPHDTPADSLSRQRGYLESLGHPDDRAQWPFLVGQPAAIKALTQSVGFNYSYDAPTKQFAHPAVLLVLTPQGKVSRYLYGVEYPSRDLRLALVEAGSGKVGTSVDRFLLTCYRYDAASRRYQPYVFGFIRIGGMLVFLSLAVLLGVLWRQERKRRTA